MAITNLQSILSGTSAQLTELAPTTFAIDVEKAARNELQWDRIIRMHQFTAPGLTRNINNVDAVTMSVKTADTTDGYQPNPVALNTNARATTVTAKVVDIWIAIDAIIAASSDAPALAKDTMTAAYVVRKNSDVMATYSDGLTQLSLANYTYEAAFLAPYSTLQGYSVRGPVHWVIPSVDTDQLYAIPQFSQAQQYGRSTLAETGDIEMAFTGLRPLNVSIWHCPDYTSSGGYNWGMMFSSKAIEYQDKMPLTIGVNDAELLVGKRALQIGATCFYSVVGTRESAGNNKWIVGVGAAA